MSTPSKMSAPTLINLPPPPSDPVTPSDIPGTPNSTTTSMSELSTVAIKDGHRGHAHHPMSRMYPQIDQAGHSANSLEAERADRISRLAGLERVVAPRENSNSSLPPGATATNSQGYFDSATQQPMHKERSTVGSASATGSIGGRTTWASSSDHYDAADKMSEDQDQDMETSSNGGFSDEGNASLVGFGEGASSTVSGPISSLPGSRTPNRQSLGYSQAKAAPMPLHMRDPQLAAVPGGGTRDPRAMDGIIYDTPSVDSADRTPASATPPRSAGREQD